MPFRADPAHARVHEHPEGEHAEEPAAWAAVRAHWERERDGLRRQLDEGRGQIRHHERRQLMHRHHQAERALDVAHRRAKEAGALPP